MRTPLRSLIDGLLTGAILAAVIAAGTAAALNTASAAPADRTHHRDLRDHRGVGDADVGRAPEPELRVDRRRVAARDGRDVRDANALDPARVRSGELAESAIDHQEPRVGVLDGDDVRKGVEGRTQESLLRRAGITVPHPWPQREAW